MLHYKIILQCRFTKFLELVYFTKLYPPNFLLCVYFKIVSFSSYTLLATFVKFLETVLESIPRNLLQLLHQFSDNIISILVAFSFQAKKQLKDSWYILGSWCQVGKIIYTQDLSSCGTHGTPWLLLIDILEHCHAKEPSFFSIFEDSSLWLHPVDDTGSQHTFPCSLFGLVEWIHSGQLSANQKKKWGENFSFHQRHNTPQSSESKHKNHIQ